jgi:hypothetical protein
MQVSIRSLQVWFSNLLPEPPATLSFLGMGLLRNVLCTIKWSHSNSLQVGGDEPPLEICALQVGDDLVSPCLGANGGKL